MKKYLFFAAAALALASCTEQVDFTQESLQTQNEGPTAVQFGTYLGNQRETRAVGDAAVDVSYTKGTIADADDATKGTTALNKARFGVFAYYTESTVYASWSPSTKYPNFMYNEEIKYDDPASGTKQWYYDNVKYWPNGEDGNNAASTPSNTAIQKEPLYLSFFAFAPYTAANGDAYAVASDGAVPVTGLSAKKTGKSEGVVAVSDNSSQTDVWVKYVMTNANASEAVDLLWGTRGTTPYNLADGTETVPGADADGNIYNVDLTKQKTNEKVNFVFKHALAKIGGATAKDTESITGNPAHSGLKVVVDVDGNSSTPKVNGLDNQSTYFPTGFNNSKTLVTLKEVKIQDGKSLSDDTSLNWISGLTSSLNTFGWFNIETGKWSTVSETYGVGTAGASYDVTANYTNDNVDDTEYTLNQDIREPASVSNPSGTWSITNTTGVTTTPKPVFCNENIPGLLVIPGGSAKIYITVTYVVRTADTKLYTGFTQVEQTITNEVTLPADLAANKYYSIIMHLGLTSVKFSATVSDWAIPGDTDGDGEIESGESESDTDMQEIWLPSNVVPTT